MSVVLHRHGNKTKLKTRVAHAPTITSTTGALATRILTAWGDQDTISYHAADFAKGQVILYGGTENSNSNPIFEVMSDPAVSFFDVRAVRVPGHSRGCCIASYLRFLMSKRELWQVLDYCYRASEKEEAQQRNIGPAGCWTYEVGFISWVGYAPDEVLLMSP